LGIPLNSSDFSFLGRCHQAKLFVHGSDDAYGALKKVQSLVRSLAGENHLVVVPGADHFFAGQLGQLDAAVTNWLGEVVRLRHSS
jgi:alpha/beta superfamily hydrolase